ncbi:response regulator [Mesorhizobium sp. BR1-1-16]|uniref:response regulator n=1 Tax=Mesorhizobium sp. BR1-1-16 TaxID=2876653 RepID=UPI001CCF23B4|nr:response regulator [Mesorhizobium sp. BR1-1-16]MBZ9936970.1 response regulator [Mesorhizobium sp. BR1-1-16]
MTMLRGSRVLIVEDEYLLASDLDRYFSSLGAVVLGPVSNVEAARSQTVYADAAVLDVDLNGQEVFPIADELDRRGVPFVFFTGRSDIAIPPRFGHAGRLSKPADSRAVLEALQNQHRKADTVEPLDDVVALLPKLRLAALLLMGESDAADHLVELTLERASLDIDARDGYASLEGWLAFLLEDTHKRRDHKNWQ